MSAEPKKLTLRIQTAEGTSRVEALSTESTCALFERVQEALQLASFAFTLHLDRARARELLSSKSRSLADCGLQHGDMLYLSPVNGAVLFDQPSTSSVQPSSSVTRLSSDTALPSIATASSSKPQEDDVDLELYKDTGRIQRPKDEKLCRHNSKGCCVHCSPLEPWDENYMKEHNIKHMSFHTYLRKLSGGKSFVVLEEPSYKIKPGCKEHPAWPRGICSACRPGDVTLARQAFRHVDNIALQHASVVERFLAEWRRSGCQRRGLLYGTYERHTALPLGIRARVAAIYEPPQESSRDHVALLPDARAALVHQLAAELGLRPVGWIFTDLLPDVACVRGADSHFLSAQECITAAHLQLQHPNPCRYSSSGYYGSKFVTVCVTGDSSQQVHLEGYQVSAQCAGLVRDHVLLPTRDAPELGAVRESSRDQYVPTVTYKTKDSYGNEVCARAGPVPVEYLLVDVPVGVEGAADAGAAGAGAGAALSPLADFPPANRPAAPQTLQALHAHLAHHEDFLEAMSDLHVLLFLASNPAAPIPLDELRGLLRAVRGRDAGAAAAWRAGAGAAGGAWRTLAALAAAAAAAPHWTCALCTYHNLPAAAACDMCAMPRNSM